jgi:hypothetical protein
MDCRYTGKCAPYNKDKYTIINYAHHRSDVGQPSVGRYPYDRENQPNRQLKYIGKNYITDLSEFENDGIVYQNRQLGNNYDTTIYGDQQLPIRRVSPGEKARIMENESRDNSDYVESIKDDPEKIMLIRKFFFTTPITAPNNATIASRHYIDLLRYGTKEEIENVVNLSKKGIYYSNNGLQDNEIRYKGKKYDCEQLKNMNGFNCLDDITGSIPHAMCGAKYKYLLGKQYNKCGLDSGCPIGKLYSNGSMTCIKDFEQAVKYGLLDDQAYNTTVSITGVGSNDINAHNNNKLSNSYERLTNDERKQAIILAQKKAIGESQALTKSIISAGLKSKDQKQKVNVDNIKLASQNLDKVKQQYEAEQQLKRQQQYEAEQQLKRLQQLEMQKSGMLKPGMQKFEETKRQNETEQRDIDIKRRQEESLLRQKIEKSDQYKAMLYNARVKRLNYIQTKKMMEDFIKSQIELQRSNKQMDKFTARPYFEDFATSFDSIKPFSNNFEKLIGKPYLTNAEVNEEIDEETNCVQENDAFITSKIRRIPYRLGQYIEYTPIRKYSGPSSINYWKQKSWSSRYIPENEKYKLENIINRN